MQSEAPLDAHMRPLAKEHLRILIGMQIFMWQSAYETLAKQI